ncbi:MAG: pyruvate:ferredoxin (flavodoxin) oxidoreductase [Gammaproteobacteria bacterium]|nr:pyruvate:ferredoxin (flavodoxin) oxidoreductase [Gammaproteobacteria bacterium]
MNTTMKAIDGNEAVARVAYPLNELCVIYPITPSSPMGEHADLFSAEGQPNLWGTVPHVVEMQSEGGASGAVHGSLQTGALTTTFTASQGLLLMIPNMYKIAGELTPTVFHVAARSIAAQALSIFGDHTDVMAVRSTGFAMLCSSSVQEAHDMALISQAATLESRVPFVHFFDGFRTSHEINKIEMLSDDQMRSMIDEQLIFEHRKRALSSEHPVIRGTAQNPDVFFQGRETVNPYYVALPSILEKVMDRFAKKVGRNYHLIDYFGDPKAKHVIVIMGSGSETVKETVEHLNKKGKSVGFLQVRLFRPFPKEHFLEMLPKSVKSLAVLDRTKEPGAVGEPLYEEVATCLNEQKLRKVVVTGGRYGLSSKEFTPAMVKGIFDELKKKEPKNHFTIGIDDDVTHTSLAYDSSFEIEPIDVVRSVFYGLGSDGTVGANKNSIKIIGENTDLYTQAYFVYDSKKSGARTVSHLRFGPNPIRSTYLIHSANFVGCHQFNFLFQTNLLECAGKKATFLLNSPYDAKEIWDHLPAVVQKHIIDKQLKFYVIDAYKLAKECGIGVHINTIMQVCFFAITKILPEETALEKIKEAIQKTYGKKGEEVVRKNFAAVDKTLKRLKKVKVPKNVTSKLQFTTAITDEAPTFVKEVTAKLMRDEGNEIPVSFMPCDGTFPSGTTKWEKRNVSTTAPVWDPETCIQCGLCNFVCPHGVIRMKQYDEKELKDAPQHLKSAALKGDKTGKQRYTLQVYVEDCTGCGLCVQNCPAKNKQNPELKAINMQEKTLDLEQDRESLRFFEKITGTQTDLTNVKTAQFSEPLFEFSGACAGCGETPYIKLVTQMFGDHMVVANATGCSSIYGGNLPTTPWTKNAEGKGPAWSNSLFEDNAEFGLGFRISEDKHHEQAVELLHQLEPKLKQPQWVKELLENGKDIDAQRKRVAQLKKKLESLNDPAASRLLVLADYLVPHSIWLMGGDVWAYDIGFGGLDHVLASGLNINVLVMDTQVYSNTGGQSSKATPRAAIAKFAAHGKKNPKKDLGLMMLPYGYVYVAQIAMMANPAQAIRAIKEAESYPGPSLILAYSQCIAHGFNLRYGAEQQKLAVNSGTWPLYRYDPRLEKEGKNPFSLDSKQPSIPLIDYMKNETRFSMLSKINPEEANMLLREAQEDVDRRWKFIEKLI